jgi:hypothetical protein
MEGAQRTSEETSIEGLVPLSEEWGDARVSRAEARKILRAGEEELDRLCERGLPSRQEDGVQTFGECDVMNAGLARGNGRSIPELARLRTLRFAGNDPSDWLAEKAWRVVATAECSCGTDEGAWSMATPRPDLYGGALDSVATSRAPGRLEAEVAVRTKGRRGAPTDPAVASVMEDVLGEFDSGRLRFHYLPAALRTDPDAAISAGVVDCVALTLHFAERLEASGIPTVTRRGHLLSTIGVEHAWLEVGEGADRAAVDPMLVALCGSLPGAAPAFADFCLGSISNRVLPWDRKAEEAVCDHGCGRGMVRLAVSARAA